jgi:dihydropteroate synthase
MFQWGDLLGLGAPVMGIVNVTPDSFSDGGRFLSVEAAAAHGAALAAAGACVLDVGGESTRPGAEPVGVDEELARVIPVVERLRAGTAVAVSIDTTKAAVAEAALAAGAVVVNDVSAGRFEPEILDVVSRAGAGYVAMHMQGEPRTMQDAPHYDDVVAEVADFLVERLDAARAAGVAPGALMADPGIGFGKTLEHNLELLAALPELAARVGVPLLVGTSRKGFLGRITGASDPADREAATIASSIWALEHGASMVRVHDVASMVAAAHAVREQAA